MYKINLYPAGLQKRAERTGRIRRFAALTLVAGVQFVLLGLFVLSALSLREEAEANESLVESNQKTLNDRMLTEGRTTINQARAILDRRVERQNWTPILAELGTLIPDALILDRIEASTATGDQAGMTLYGHLRHGSSMDPVLDLARKLSASAAYRGQFAEARVDRMDTSGENAKFSIVCPLRAALEKAEDGSD